MKKNPSPKPPAWADKILQWYCSPHFLEEVQGDLHEWFYRRVKKQGPVKAKLLYPIDVIRFFRTFRLKNYKEINSKSVNMIGHYLKINGRLLKKDRLYSIIRVSNLVIGISIALITWLYIQFETGYDRFHSNSENIYRLQHINNQRIWAATPRGSGVFARDHFTAIKNMARFSTSQTLVRKNDQTFQESNLLFTDSTVFNLFDFEVLSGNPDQALVDPLSVVITESMARKYFGDQDPLNQELFFEFDRGRGRKVTAVIKNVPFQSHIQFDFLLSIYSQSAEYNLSWSNWGTYTYLLIDPNADFEVIKKRIAEEYYVQYEVELEDRKNLDVMLMPLERIHLYSNAEKEMSSNSNINYLYILSITGLLVLLISSINFINLTVVRSIGRGKEIGIRKTLGAQKKSIINQFLGESYFLIIGSALFSVIAVYLLLPYLQSLTGLPIPFRITGPDSFLIPLLVLIFALGIVCGIYPAYLAARFHPNEILKSDLALKGKRSGLARKTLIIVQFSLSLLLIIASVVIYNQMQFLVKKDLGFEKDQILLVHLNYAMNDKLDVFEEQLRSKQDILEVSHSSSAPGYRIMREGITDIQSGAHQIMRLLLASHEFIETYDLKLLAGRTFSKNKSSQESEWILNKAAVESLFEPAVDPIGRELAWNDTARVVGIVDNFHFQSLHEQISPLAIKLLPTARRFASLRFAATSTEQALADLKDVFSVLYPDLPPVHYEFLDQRFATLYQAEQKLQSLIFIFCGLSLALTFSGIFAITAFVTQQKTKEVAIRKVLGGSFLNIIGIIGKTFSVSVMISILITLPIAIYLINWWLLDFAYHITPGIGIYLLSAVTIILLVIVSSAYNTLKVAHSNPTKSLRSE